MAMEIKVNGSAYKTDYADRLQTEREKTAKAENSQNGEKTAGAGSAQKEAQASNQKPAPHDEYISSEKSGEKPNGLYHVGQDENGNKKVYFNDPKKGGGDKSPKVNAGAPDGGEEKCVGNTDQVDREIRELKEKKKQLEQQIKAASGDEKKMKELENKLAQVEQELAQKDTDTYRRQHSTFTDKK
jgi:hypothetical protein